MMLTFFPIYLYYIFVIGLFGVNGKSGEYFEYYNQSSFAISGSYPECIVKATYDSGGNKDSNYVGCEWDEKVYESQQKLGDLEFYELAKICPTLNYLNPTLMPSIPQHGLPPSSQLLFSDEWRDNSCTDSKNDCPRFKCDNSSTLETYDTEYNRSFSYYPISELIFESKALYERCRWCICSPFTTTSGVEWAWDCTGNTPLYEIYTWNPINNVPSNRYCAKETNSPTLVPTVTVEPTTATTTPTTFSPTSSPTAKCMDAWENSTNPNVRGNKYSVGSYYWTTDNVENCTNLAFCYCNDNGVPYCKWGWDQIMGDDLLYYGFLTDVRGCASGAGYHNYLTECWNDRTGSRLFTWFDYTVDNSPETPFCEPDKERLCPRCGCTDTPYTQSSKTNTTFNTTTNKGIIKNDSLPLVETEWTYTYYCASCKCILENSPNGWVSWVDPVECNYYDQANNEEQSDCIFNELKCYKNDGEYDPNAGRTTCTNQRINGLSDFNTGCGFKRLTLDTSPDDVCVEVNDEIEGEWDCAPSYECDAIGGPGCYSASFNYDVYQYDCITDKWLIDTYSANMRYSCCDDGFNCNNRTIEDYLDDDCQDSSALATYYKYKEECTYSQRNILEITDDPRIIRTAFCGDSLDYYSFEEDPEENGSSYCDILRVYWRYNTFCQCNEARSNIQRVKNANDGTGMGQDGDKIIQFYENAFWSNSINEPNNEDKSSRDYPYDVVISNLFTMYKYWNCSNFEDAEDESDKFENFFTCDFEAEPDSINNDDSSSIHNSPSSFLYLFSLCILYYLFGNKSFIFIQIGLISLCFGSADLYWDGPQTGDGISKFNDCRFRGRQWSQGWMGSSISTDQLCENVEHLEYVYQDEDGLSWDKLIFACPELEYSGCYTPDEQINMNDLIWPLSDAECSSCPRCPCSDETDTIRHFVKNVYYVNDLDNLFNRYCYQCSCLYWPAAKQYAWNCTDNLVTQKVPYSLNDTDFCGPTDSPTSAPTPPLNIECKVGNNFYSDTQYGVGGSSHCGWLNVSVDKYENSEPAVCALDNMENIDPTEEYQTNSLNQILTPSWFISSNREPICLAIAGDNVGAACYYKSFDVDLSSYDCILDTYVTDTYKMDATIFCCNDGPYCNNQTIINANSMNDPYVTYSNYLNESIDVKCQESSKLAQYIQIVIGCPYSKKDGFDDDYIRSRECYQGKSKNKPNCKTIENYWKYATYCHCKKTLFYLNNVNDTYDEYINDDFDDKYSSLRSLLHSKGSQFDCEWQDDYTEFICNASKKLKIYYNLILSIIIISYRLFIQ